LTLRANAPSQGGAKYGEAIWGERNSEIGLSFGIVIFKIFSREWIKPNAWYATERSAKGGKRLFAQAARMLPVSQLRTPALQK
jgi:hypothetical protein